MAYELNDSGLVFELQRKLLVRCKKVKLDCHYRLDVIVEGLVILELKSVDSLIKVHEAQLLTYMGLSQISTSLLLNFNAARLVDGIKRFKL